MSKCDQKLSNVNHMTNLRRLVTCGDCGIDDNCIKNINLEKLIANNNQRITHTNHNTIDTQHKRSIMLLHDDIFRDIMIVHIFNDD